MRATAQHEQDSIVHELLTPRDGEGPSDTAAAEANEAVYNSLVASSPTQGLLTPRKSIPGARKAAVAAKVLAGDVGINADPWCLSGWSALSSPEQLHSMHATSITQHAARVNAEEDAAPQASSSAAGVCHCISMFMHVLRHWNAFIT